MVFAGAQAPEALEISVSNVGGAADPLDLSTVTEAEFAVTTPTGRRVTWATTIASQSAAALVLQHVFALADVDTPGPYRITVYMTVPGGVRRAGPTTLQVVAP